MWYNTDMAKATKNKFTKQPKLSATELAKLKYVQLKSLLPGGKLGHGSHNLIEDSERYNEQTGELEENVDPSVPEGVCLMEAVAWVSGEEHSDEPQCACPQLTALGISINDSTDDAGRQALIPAIPALVGSRTASKRTRFRRAKRAVELALEYLDLDATCGNDLGERLAIERMQPALGGPLTRKKLSLISETLDYLSESGSIDSEFSDAVSALDDCWNTDGISLRDYEKVLGVDYTNIIQQKDQPAFFVEVATQRG
jgi:hypothetical protein